MSKEFLNGSKIDPTLQEMRCKRVSQGVNGDSFLAAGFCQSSCENHFGGPNGDGFSDFLAREKPVWGDTPVLIQILIDQSEGRFRKEGDPVLFSLALSYVEHTPAPVQIAKAEADHLTYPETGTIGHTEKSPVFGIVGGLNDLFCLLLGKNGWKSSGLSRAIAQGDLFFNDILIEKLQCRPGQSDGSGGPGIVQ